ncbi:hypothetical protein [Dethiobacter alkaliphilus]|uniref:Lipoprotein n=1 Tax=Dethiobacter alkaliphilus AHT 1 TaxID=555088 RepID=C0GK76_DETAL|nr:hypothetical protein [Dethiobacter alkaliphilus]EEG76259.1 hypothetical protein DealDRAFT_2885 [Dethiobacter alkaliphilus AHT 1]
MKRVILLLCLAILAVGAGCSTEGSPSYTVNSYDEFIEVLQARGYEITEIDEEKEEITKSTFFSEYPKSIQINSEEHWVQVYEFSDRETAKAEAETISEDGLRIGNVLIDWSTKIYFYQKNKLIVYHGISDQKLLADFESILGKPIRQTPEIN